MAALSPLTISDWLDAWRDGADPRVLLSERRARIIHKAPQAVWLHHVGDEAFETQILALEDILRTQDDRRALLDRYPLFGVPFAVKDNIDIAGEPTTAACPAFRYVAAQSATVVRRLVAAGAVWMGKTNLDQFATGLVGTRSPYGVPSSVFSAEHISGGSSSGSAVAVALGHVAFALGTDTAGSGRIPAAFNQIVGMKPTPGRVSTTGVVPACRSLDCVSVFALTVDDAGQVLAAIEGADSADPYARHHPGPATFPSAALRIGIPSTLRLGAGHAYMEPYADAREFAVAQGHALIPIDFEPLARTAELLYTGPWVAERHAVVQELLDRNPDALDPAVRRIIQTATRYSATDYFRAEYKLRALQSQNAMLWERIDILLVPTAPLHPRMEDVAADPLGINAVLGTYTNFVNLLGWCALALPAGYTADGMPFGVTAIARANHDAALAAFGRDWQRELDLPLGITRTRPSDSERASARQATALRVPEAQRTLPIAVVGAHLSGMPLNSQLQERGARLVEVTTTAPHYCLYALPGTTPPKPGMVRNREGGRLITVEVWDLPVDEVGAFLALVPAPLALGKIELADGRWVHGFVCEAQAVARALDISSFGGWREYLASLDNISAAA